jgi:hypothetical protein
MGGVFQIANRDCALAGCILEQIRDWNPDFDPVNASANFDYLFGIWFKLFAAAAGSCQSAHTPVKSFRAAQGNGKGGAATIGIGEGHSPQIDLADHKKLGGKWFWNVVYVDESAEGKLPEFGGGHAMRV